MFEFFFLVLNEYEQKIVGFSKLILSRSNDHIKISKIRIRVLIFYLYKGKL